MSETGPEPDPESLSDRDAVPPALRDYDQWVCWKATERDGKTTKRPVDPDTGRFASTTDADSWSDFKTAIEFASQSSIAGIGFVFSTTDPFVGVDLDDCRDPESGEMDEQADRIIRTLDSYTEVSPSGTGFHVIARGELPSGRNRQGSVEMYKTARFFTVTGDHVENTPVRLQARADAVASVHAEHVAVSTESQPAGPDSDGGTALDNSALIERAKQAENGEKFSRLWRGSIGSYPSQSEADMALCCLLAFWTGRDANQMDQLFRSSGLMREKWDEQHFADGSTYGEKTIERAIEVTDEVYDPESSGERATNVSGTTVENAVVELDNKGEGTDSKSRKQLVEENRLLKQRIHRLYDELETRTEQLDQIRTELEAAKQASTCEGMIEPETPEECPEQPATEQAPSGWIQRLRTLW